MLSTHFFKVAMCNSHNDKTATISRVTQVLLVLSHIPVLVRMKDYPDVYEEKETKVLILYCYDRRKQPNNC